MAEAQELHLAFEGYSPPKKDAPVKFSLNGKSFECIGGLPVTAAARISGKQQWPANDLIAFIEKVLVEKDVPRFIAELDRKDKVTDTDLLAQIVMQLLGALTARPTEPLGGSSNGQPATGRSSKAKSH